MNPFVALQAWLYRSTGGRVGGTFRGAPVMLLTTRGRRSGRPRTTPVLYVHDGDSYVTVASNAGRDASPSWWKNLQQQPEASIQVKREQIQVRARKASPEEKSRLWPLLVKVYPTYGSYQRKTKRVIPVVILERRPRPSE